MKLFALLAFFSSCGTPTTPSSAGDTLVIKLHETFEIKLSAVMASGQSWSLADSAFRKIVTLDTSFTISNPDMNEGDPELQVFKFRGISRGKTTLHFIHKRPWRKEDPPSKERHISVTVQ